MTNLVVGDKGCTFTQILETITDSTDKPAVLGNWKALARAVGTDKVMIADLDRDVLLDKKNRVDVIEDILIDWRCRVAGEATLGELMNLVVKCNWTELKESLRKLGNIKAVASKQNELNSQTDETDTAVVERDMEEEAMEEDEDY